MRPLRSASRSSRQAERACFNDNQPRRIPMTRKFLTTLAACAVALGIAAAPAARAANAPLGVAFVYLGNPGDAGWTFAHHAGSLEAEAKFGNRIKMTRVENVP